MEKFDEIAISMYAELNSCQKVAKRLNVSPSTIHRALTRNGIKLPHRGDEALNNRKRKLVGDVADNVVAAYVRGDSMREIQKAFNCAQGAIYTALKIAGVKRRPKGQQPRELTQEEKNSIVQLRVNHNLSQAVIATQIGCHQTAVSNHLREMGVVCRPCSVGHGSWKGGRVKLSSGYIGVLVDSNWPYRSMINSAGYVPEHRKVMAEHLGRALERHETVHHKDGDRKNNSIENLQIHSGKHGRGVHMCCRNCGSHDIDVKDI